MTALDEISSSQSTLFSKSLKRSGSLIAADKLHADHSDHHHDHSPKSGDSAVPLLRNADFDGNGKVNRSDINKLTAHLFSSKGENKYHPLYDLNADYKINQRDLLRATADLGTTSSLLDQQIARATQATMRYYGSNGVKHAIADGFLPFTQELKGHGVHYINLNLALQIGNQKQLDIERPVGLNFDDEGHLAAVFYLRVPRRLQATPENPARALLIDPTDDAPPDTSFATLTPADWHHHHSPWVSGLGNLDPKRVYFEEDVPPEIAAQRFQQAQFKFFPQSDQYYVPKLWMLHGWFHSLNPSGVFGDTNPNLSPYAPEELGDPHHELTIPLIRGTEASEAILGAAGDERINGFGGDDSMTGNGGHDHLWGSFGNDLLLGDFPLQQQSQDSSLASDSHKGHHGKHQGRHQGHGEHQGEHPGEHLEHDDILYGGTGEDRLYGQTGNDKLFGGVNNDDIHGGAGDDILRGGLGRDALKGGSGRDSFVLAIGEGRDTIADFKIKSDKLILVGGLMPESLSITQQQNNTLIHAGNETIAVLTGVNANQLIGANVFIVA